MSDIFRAYNYAADSKSVKIPDVDFDLPKVTIEEQEELPPEEAFMEFTPESFSSVEEQIIEPEEEQEKLVYPTREELAEFYRDELNAIALEVEIKAYSDALQSKKAELQNSIDSISQKINEMEELQKAFLEDYEKKLKFFAIDIAEKLVCKKISEDDLYFKISDNAIKMAKRIEQAFVQKGYKIFIDSPTNQKFIVLENSKMQELKKSVSFSYWQKFDENHTVVRFATSWATTDEQVDELLRLI